MMPSRLVGCAALLAVVACSDPAGPGTSSLWGPGRILTGGGGGGDASAVASVAVTPAAVVLAVGDSVRLVGSAANGSGQVVTDATFAWTSSDVRVARVRVEPQSTAVAVVTAVGLGSATVTLSAGAVAAPATVTVVAAP